MHTKIYNTPTIKLVKTCSGCPEQYDAYCDEVKVGYLRLRHGMFTVEYPDVDGVLIYCALPHGEGEFRDDERDYYLKQAVNAILIYMDRPQKPPAPHVQYIITKG